jgi:1-acyl-sn-glycerol-3-phosphate acyltransferase
MIWLLGSIAFWSFLFVSSVLLFPVAVLIWAATAPFDPRKRLLHRFTCFWASLYTWFNPAWRVTVEGREKVRTDCPTVMVANHLSLLDILVMFRTFLHFKWVSKIEVFRVPFIGWNMALNGYVKLKRGDRGSVVQMLRRCEEVLAGGNSVMIFPEGTRSPTGVMRDFKAGAFEIAIRTRSPLQPILIRGTAGALPKRGFVLRGRHPIHVTFLDSIPPESFAGLSSEELARQVRSTMVKACTELG